MGKKLIFHIAPASAAITDMLKSRIMGLNRGNFSCLSMSATYENFLADPSVDLDGICRYIESKWMTRDISIVRDLLFFVEVFRETRKNKPDVVITYGPKPGLYARIAAKLAGTPLVMHVSWGLFFREHDGLPKKTAIASLELLSTPFSDVVFSVNKDDIKVINKVNIFRRPVKYLGNATNIHEIFNAKRYSCETIESLKKKYGITTNTTVTLIGRVVREKGYIEYIDAAKRLESAHKGEVTFLMVGHSDDARGNGLHIKELIKDHDILRYIGAVPVEEMPDILAISDIVCLPSYREGFPRSLVEAAAMSKPIVTTDTRGCREAVDHGKNGFLVPVRDAYALSQRLDTLISNPEMRASMGRYSRKIAEERFDEKNLINTLLTTINSELQKKFKGRR